MNWLLLAFAPLMDSESPKILEYKRARFVTHLPMDYLYTPGHFWIERQEGGLWRVGFTKFATRMLGEMVDHGFDVQVGVSVGPGQRLGWVEGFKAVSDLLCVGEGQFAGGNPALKENLALINRDPFGSGWLYALTGKPDATAVDVRRYAKILDQTIDEILRED